MTRTLFFFTCLVAMIATLTALVIRSELAQPGVSVLFQDQNGAPDGARFGTVAMAHALFSYLAVMLLGTTMIAAAREKGAHFAGLLMWLGVLICSLMALLILATEIPLRWLHYDFSEAPTIGSGVGWVLYPPLSPPNEISVASYLFSFITPDVSFFDPEIFGFADLSRYFVLPAASLLLIGALTMLSTEHGFGWVGVIGAIIVVIVAILSAPLVPSSQATFLMSGWLCPAFLLLACSSIRVLDGGPTWAMVLAIGAAATILAQIGLMVHPSTLLADGTIAEVMSLYVFPFGLVWFALPALILFRDGTRIGDVQIWAVTGAITLGLILWTAPLIGAGHMGQPFRYVDYPDAFAVPNMIASIAAVVFTALMLCTVVYLRRTRT